MLEQVLCHHSHIFPGVVQSESNDSHSQAEMIQRGWDVFLFVLKGKGLCSDLWFNNGEDTSVKQWEKDKTLTSAWLMLCPRIVSLSSDLTQALNPLPLSHYKYQSLSTVDRLKQSTR
jgi:hypothetical protein